MDNEMVFIADSHGALHLMDLPNLAIKVTYLLSSNALSTPLLIGSHTSVLGSYDGMLRCVNDTGMIWERPVGAAVSRYSKPVMLRSSDAGTIVVSTTAEDLVALDASTGKIQCRDHIPGEIWSDIEVEFSDTLIFGAKDSSYHLHTK
jgi:outer membrane protein assembly factor BamB